MNPAQLVQDHWEFMQRITNDDDEAQQLALRVLEKFEQFKPERGTPGQFIKLKLRELRQHYSDKGVVYHPCRKESGGYVSLDEIHDDDTDDGAGDDEEIERNFYNLLPAPCISQLEQAEVRRKAVGRWKEYTKRELAKCGRDREARRFIVEHLEYCRRGIGYFYRDQCPSYCMGLGDLGRCPEPTKLKPRHKRSSRKAFQREMQAQAADAPRLKARIYYAKRAAGQTPLPKDTLWRLDGVTLRVVYDLDIKRRNGLGRWHRLDDKDEWAGLAHLRAYLARNGMAQRLPRLKPPLSRAWLTILALAKRLQQRASPQEDLGLLWAALRVLCHKRAWPPGIPAKKIFPEDQFSPRERLLRQARHVLLAAGLRVPVRRSLRRIRQHAATKLYSTPLHQ